MGVALLQPGIERRAQLDIIGRRLQAQQPVHGLLAGGTSFVGSGVQ